jgi:hypothetical protein
VAVVTEEVFTEEEKAAARKKHGDTKLCLRCRAVGRVDDLFGWRRMKPSDAEIRPQGWCIKCRSEVSE